MNRFIQIAANERAQHQASVAKLLGAGLRKHGWKVEVVPDPQSIDADVGVAWGWRGAQLARAERVLVAERAYLGDRFHWFSLGWDGLNGRATFPESGGPERLARHFPGVLKPWVEREGPVLVLGQVPTDAAVPPDYEQRLHRVTRSLKHHREVWFRPHPQYPQLRVACDRALSVDEPLEDQLGRVSACLTFSSNAGVLAVCEGIPTITLDKGSMAWDVTSHEPKTIIRPDRQDWAERLAWCQWLPEELEDGSAWERLETCL